ncbi:MAG: hypothetical protein JWN66_3265 [Sphingomonas bacterium]|uniref:hypothetical protein n=1 Tax=Sphingomonas bacterium TaxID=1895847 RepID=UPI002624F865|nr:hypothetical protein [Sphingomonas bacterium]MDB5706149.1 hypothetical protein [Sphingomonas bacterium]
MAFVNAYGFAQPASFRRCFPTKAGTMLAVGTIGGDGLAAEIAANGDCLWSRRYNFANHELELLDGVEAPDGHLLLAAARRSDQPGSLLALRIAQSGAILSTRELLDTGADSGARIVRSAKPAFETLVLAGPQRSASAYQRSAGRLVQLDSNNDVLSAVDVIVPGGGRLFAGVADTNGYLLVGDIPEARPLSQWQHAGYEAELDATGAAGLVVEIDPVAATIRCWRLLDNPGVPAGASLRAVARRADGSFVIAGCRTLGKSRWTFAAEVARSAGDVALSQAWIYEAPGVGDRPAAVVALPVGARILDHSNAAADSARVLRLGADLQATAASGFDLAAPAQLLDLALIGAGQVALTGATGDQALLLSVDAGLECCKTVPNPPPAGESHAPLIQPFRVDGVPVPSGGKVDLTSTPLKPAVAQLCGSGVDKWGDTTLVQSPYLNLQVAGSTGADASAGMLLRWFLLGTLGENHLPKGDMASAIAPGGFNRLADDHVILRRAEWPAAPPVRALDFAIDRPLHVDNDERIFVFQTGTGVRQALFHVHFPDADAFTAAALSTDALNNPAAFIAAYGALPIEVELREALAIGCDIDFQPVSGCAVRLETLSAGENVATAPKQVSGRHVLSAADGPVRRLFADNIRSLRVECIGTHVGRVAFICYDDLLGDLDQAQAWTDLGRFALTDQQNEAFARFEDSSRFQVDGHWRRFNDGAFVNIANYHDRWTDPDGLGQAVQAYVQRSDTDPRAMVTLPSVNYPEEGGLSVSYLDLLGVAALDYHAARALGLGHIDTGPADAAKTWLYLIEYRTDADLQDGKGVRDVQHLWLGMPTRLADERLPMTPGLDPVEYGLEVPTGSGGTHSLTNAQGYTPDGGSRYIRLHPTCPPLQSQPQGFFDPPVPFDLSQAALPACYGIEYRVQGATAWIKPEIAHDPHYLDTSTIAESTPSPFPATLHGAPFVHRETIDGIREYGAYAINIFFRASTTSAVQATDTSVFRRANRLLPPSDLNAQLIQRESPCVLTTEAEQSMLESLVALPTDPTLIRLCFNYGFAQDAAYDFADKVELFFRPLVPRSVSGGVKTISPDSDPARVRIELENYQYASTAEIAHPALLQADRANFIGGALTAGTRRFVIEEIPVTGANPVFVVRKPTVTGVEHSAGTPGNPGIDTLVVQYAPLGFAVGDLAMAVENMADAANWGIAHPDPAPNPLAAVVTIGHSDWQTYTETFTSGGVPTSRRLRGFWEQALVTPVASQPGSFRISFAGFTLPTHAQSSAAAPVSWWRGTVRVPVANHDAEDRRSLKVLRMQTDTVTGLFELIAQDDSGSADLPLTSATDPVLVNYYPGYRVYLGADPAHGLDAAGVMPATGQGSRLTLIGARSCDTLGADNSGQLYDYRSNIGTPTVIGAVEIIAPGVPDRPTGLLYATPPDGGGFSTYSFTLGFQGRIPYALAFFRADALSILRTLYEPSTLAELTAWLFPPKPDSSFTDQFHDLLDFVESPTRTSPDAFETEQGNKTLPYPDNPLLGLTGSMSLATAKAVMRDAVVAAFVGLTEQPLPYSLIDDRLPTNARQVFRDRNGALLTPGTTGFDLTPMARKLSDGSVQFVDFSLGGAMNANTVYFYFAREIGSRLELGAPSPILGPVALVNLAAPLAPLVRRVTSIPVDEATAAPARVAFELVTPSATDPVARLRIYRALDPLSALSIRTMTLLPELTIDDLPVTPDGTLLASDEFSTGDPPFGESLFYRLVWAREVRYLDLANQVQFAEALSEPTQALFTAVVDIASPEAPVPSISALSTDPEGRKLLRISWPKTAHNATYHVSQLDASGNWFRLGSVISNEALVTFDLPVALPPAKASGDPIFYRFKIDAESSGGRVSLYDAPVTANLLAL